MAGGAARLAEERERAETLAGIVKRFGDAEARAAAIYADGRATVEALVAALGVALAEGSAACAFETLEARLAAAVNARERLAALALDLVERRRGEKELLSGLVGAGRTALVAAKLALW
ncbi:MAG: hypothetical protein AAF713_22580 [Pseudomonadota bacterium]